MGECKYQAQGKECCLEKYHDGVHTDSIGFRFIDDKWPNHLGNGPSGYPMNNPAFDKAVEERKERRKEAAKKAEEFQRKLRNALRNGK